MRAASARHALSIDLEDWYHPEILRERIDGEPASQVAELVRPVLALLEARGVRATFFVLGAVARECPQLIERIAAAGHEIASHGVSHRPLWELSPDEFRGELAEFRSIIDGILGVREIRGFRAPTFSLDQRTSWALPILEEFGYRYDSSIFPIWNGFYGVPSAPLAPYRVQAEQLTRRSDSGLVEFPMTAMQLGPARLPISGGFYLRLLPFPILRAALRRVAGQRPFVLYLHPWEFGDTPTVEGLGARDRFILRYGRRSVLPKLEALLDEFEFAPLDEVLDDLGF